MAKKNLDKESLTKTSGAGECSQPFYPDKNKTAPSPIKKLTPYEEAKMKMRQRKAVDWFFTSSFSDDVE